MATHPLIVSLRIPGHWRDAWLYREHLLVWRRDNSMLSTRLDAVMAGITREYDTSTATALEYLLMRNDWKTSDQFRKLMSVSGVDGKFRAALRAIDGAVTVQTNSLGLEPANVEPAAGVMLDSHVYANRIYCASTQGLFESYFYAQPGYDSRQEQLMSRRVADVSAKYACLNVSAEEEGLWFQPISFESGRNEPAPEFERVADVSLGNSYASRHLLNYLDSAVPEFLRADAHKGRVTEGAEYEEWQVRGYQQPRDITRAAVTALNQRQRVELDEVDYSAGVEDSDIQVLGNSDYRLLIERRKKLHVLDISAYENKDIALRPDQRFASTARIPLDSRQVLATYAIGAGFLVETFDEVRLLTETGSHAFFTGPAARVRTFTSSRRHKDVAIVIDDDALTIVGFLS